MLKRLYLQLPPWCRGCKSPLQVECLICFTQGEKWSFHDVQNRWLWCISINIPERPKKITEIDVPKGIPKPCPSRISHKQILRSYWILIRKRLRAIDQLISCSPSWVDSFFCKMYLSGLFRGACYGLLFGWFVCKIFRSRMCFTMEI